jgi:hypothetical protein
VSSAALRGIIWFGWANLALICGMVLILGWMPDWLPYRGEGLTFTLILQLAVSLGLIFTTRQKRAGSLLGSKTFPAAIVAYGLFLLMAQRWLSGSP